jgi:hypothetical protein
MPGQSFVERPDSLSAAFEDYLRRALVPRGAEIAVPVIGLAAPLRARYRETGTHLFYPHEGHLNPAGHRVVAELALAPLRVSQQVWASPPGLLHPRAEALLRYVLS